MIYGGPLARPLHWVLWKQSFVTKWKMRVYRLPRYRSRGACLRADSLTFPRQVLSSISSANSGTQRVAFLQDPCHSAAAGNHLQEQTHLEQAWWWRCIAAFQKNVPVQSLCPLPPDNSSLNADFSPRTPQELLCLIMNPPFWRPQVPLSD